MCTRNKSSNSVQFVSINPFRWHDDDHEEMQGNVRVCIKGCMLIENYNFLSLSLSRIRLVNLRFQCVKMNASSMLDYQLAIFCLSLATATAIRKKDRDFATLISKECCCFRAQIKER